MNIGLEDFLLLWYIYLNHSSSRTINVKQEKKFKVPMAFRSHLSLPKRHEICSINHSIKKVACAESRTHDPIMASIMPQPSEVPCYYLKEGEKIYTFSEETKEDKTLEEL